MTAKDSGGSTVTGYSGTVHLTSSDGAAVLPADYTFSPLDNGTKTFTFGVTLKTAGTQSITATDTGTLITGVTSGVTVLPAGASILVLAGYPTPQFVGTAGNVTVTAKDAFGNIATGYSGTIQFTSTDTAATLPDYYSFLPGDNGVKTFSVTFATAGSQNITATDTITSSVTGTQSGITINLVPTIFTWANAAAGFWADAANWTNNAGIVMAPLSAGAANYVLNFNKTGTYTVTHNLDNGFLLNQLNFGGATATVAGYNLTLGGTAPAISQTSTAAVTINNNLVLNADTAVSGSGSGSVTLAGVITGTGALTKNSSGILYLAGVGVNNFSGGLTVNTGTLFLSNTSNTLMGTGTVTINSGATLNLNGNGGLANAFVFNDAHLINGNSFQALFGGGVTLGGTATTVDLGASGNMVFNCIVSGTGGLTSVNPGQGPITLNGVNTYTGATTLNSGAIRLGASASIDTTSSISLASGTVLDVSAKTSNYVLGATTTLIAKGTGATISNYTPFLVLGNAAAIIGRSGGVVDLGAQPIHLEFHPTSTAGDTTHPALVVSQATLNLNNNPLQVTLTGVTLGAGTYRLIQVGDGSTGVITQNALPSYAVTITGTGGLAANCSATVSVSNGNLVMTVSSEPFQPWIATYFPTPGDPRAAKDADPDGDGLNNLQEFAFDSDPTAPASSGKVRSRVTTIGSDQVLVITLPVRGTSSSPAFTGDTAKSATVDSLIYTISGSLDLASWDQAVTEVTPAESDMPVTLDSGWSYRTFRLAAPVIGTNPTGFLRVTVAPGS